MIGKTEKTKTPMVKETDPVAYSIYLPTFAPGSGKEVGSDLLAGSTSTT
jgi:hypothetical protein